MNTQKLILRAFWDAHAHLRVRKMLKDILKFTARICSAAIVMPNTSMRGILTGLGAWRYKNLIEKEARAQGYEDFTAHTLIKLTDQTTPRIIREAHRYGVLAAKGYPAGVTTNSQYAVSNFLRLYPTFAEMEQCGMTLCVHGQVPDTFCLDREKRFLEILVRIHHMLPGLRIVLEHVSTKAAVNVINGLPPNVVATVTAHHLMMTLDDVLVYKCRKGKEGLNPHNYCQPILQYPDDREAINEAVMSGNRKFFYGSDSAAHRQSMKECGCGNPGVYSAPSLPSALVEHFDGRGKIELLKAFTSEIGPLFYNKKVSDRTITLIRKPWRVPYEIDGIVPMCAGKTLQWQVAK